MVYKLEWILTNRDELDVGLLNLTDVCKVDEQSW